MVKEALQYVIPFVILIIILAVGASIVATLTSTVKTTSTGTIVNETFNATVGQNQSLNNRDIDSSTFVVRNGSAGQTLPASNYSFEPTGTATTAASLVWKDNVTNNTQVFLNYQFTIKDANTARNVTVRGSESLSTYGTNLTTLASVIIFGIVIMYVLMYYGGFMGSTGSMGGSGGLP